MTDYTKSVNFAAKDDLPSGDTNKLVKGTEINTEFNNIATAVNGKANKASPALTGTVLLNGVAITSTADELNILDGVTTTALELNVLDGITTTTVELNKLDGLLATTTELNYVEGVTAPIQTQLNTKAPTASPAFTGVPTAPTATTGTSTTQLATTAFATAAADAATIDGLTASAAELNILDGATVTTAEVNLLDGLTSIAQDNASVISTNTTAVTGTLYIFTATLTLTLPASPTLGDRVSFSNRSGTETPIIARNGQPIMGIAEDMTVDNENFFGTLVYADATRGWVFK